MNDKYALWENYKNGVLWITTKPTPYTRARWGMDSQSDQQWYLDRIAEVDRQNIGQHPNFYPYPKPHSWMRVEPKRTREKSNTVGI